MRLKYHIILILMLMMSACEMNINNDSSINLDETGGIQTVEISSEEMLTGNISGSPTSTTFPQPEDTETPTPRPSPSGRLVFASRSGTKWTLFSYDLDTGILSPLLEEQFDDVYMLSSDANGEILVADVKINRASYIYLIDLSDNSIIDLIPERTWDNHAWISPDGSMVAFSSPSEGWFNIFIYRIADGSFENLTGNSFRNCEVAAWSPDNQQILFFSDMDGSYGSNQPYVIDLVSSEVYSVGHVDSTYLEEGTWSADGNYLLYKTISDELFRVDSNGENQISLLRNEFEINHISWSPDSTILFMIGNENLYLVDVETGEIELLAAGEQCEGCGYPNWSQNGDYVAYIDPPEIKIIYLDNIDDSNVITSTGGYLNFLLWLP